MTENTLDLVGDGDDLDMVVDAETIFGIKFENDELLNTHTVGQFYDLIIRKHRGANPGTRACLTQVAFYRLRRALKDMGVGHPITPATCLTLVVPSSAATNGFRRIWKELGRRASLKLPHLELPWTLRLSWPFSTTSRLWSVGFYFVPGALALALAIALERPTGMSVGWLMFTEFAVATAMAVIASVLAHLFFATIPRRLETVGDLAREAAGRSFAELQREKGSSSPSDVWYAMTASLRDISGHKAPINRETAFFAHRNSA